MKSYLKALVALLAALPCSIASADLPANVQSAAEQVVSAPTNAQGAAALIQALKDQLAAGASIEQLTADVIALADSEESAIALAAAIAKAFINASDSEEVQAEVAAQIGAGIAASGSDYAEAAANGAVDSIETITGSEDIAGNVFGDEGMPEPGDDCETPSIEISPK